MVDDTGIPKKGVHSVGVVRQYCGQLGKQDSCQVAVTLSLAADHASLPIAHRFYLPQVWADDPVRRARAGVPDDVVFQTKPQIALAQIRAAVQAGVSVCHGAGRCRIRHRYCVQGWDHRTRADLRRRHPVPYQPVAPGIEPLPPKPWSGRGRPTSLVRRDADHAPMPAKALAASLPKRA